MKSRSISSVLITNEVAPEHHYHYLCRNLIINKFIRISVI